MKRTCLHPITTCPNFSGNTDKNKSCVFHPATKKTNYSRMKHLKKIILIVAGSVFLFCNCTYHNEIDYFKVTPIDSINSCDTANMSFKTDVYPVISASCVGCHSNSGFSLEGYDNVKKNSVRMMKAIEHQSGAPAMPQGGSKLPDCTINKLNAWISQGLKNN
jgi:hypothetical protein